MPASATRTSPAKGPASKTQPVRRTRKAAPAAAFQEPLATMPEPPAQPQIEPGRPSMHNGVAVVREELIANLPSGAAFKISKLHLADGGLAYACRDCVYTGDKRVDLQRHRNDEHGAKFGKRTPRVAFAPDKVALDFVLPPRGEEPAPTMPMEMTLAEILSLMPTLAAAADLIEHLEYERDAAIGELKHQRANQHKIDVYEALSDEVVELRMKVKDTGSYEELRAEVLHLRTWKKNMIKKLSGLGFQFADEEQQ